MSDEVHQENVSDGNEQLSLEEMKAKLASAEKAANDFKSDMFKYKEQAKSQAEKLEEFEAKMPNDDELKALREFQAEQKRKLEEEARLSVDKMETLKKAEMKALAEKLEGEKSSLAKQIEEQNSLIRELTVNTQITQAAVEAGAVKPEQIIQLIGSQFDTIKDDSGKMRVVSLDENGEPKRGENGVLTVKDVVSGYLQENPHFLKAAEVPSGTGGKGSLNQTATPMPNVSDALKNIHNGSDKLAEAAGLATIIKG